MQLTCLQLEEDTEVAASPFTFVGPDIVAGSENRCPFSPSISRRVLILSLKRAVLGFTVVGWLSTLLPNFSRHSSKASAIW
jgi:hypothetical protein